MDKFAELGIWDKRWRTPAARHVGEWRAIPRAAHRQKPTTNNPSYTVERIGQRMQKTLWAVALALAGALAALFLVFQPLFTDGPASVADPERLASYALTFTGFGALAWLGARFGPWERLTVAWLGAPALLVGAFYGDADFVLRLLVMGATAAGLVVGVLLAERLAPQPTAA